MGITGVYILRRGHDIVYIGKSIDIGRRIKTHIREKAINFNFFSTIKLDKCDITQIESLLIQKYAPIYNNPSLYATESANGAKKRNEIDTTKMAKSLCEYCNSEFIKRTTFAKFCCSACRVGSHVEKRIKNGLPVSKYIAGFAAIKQI